MLWPASTTADTLSGGGEDDVIFSANDSTGSDTLSTGAAEHDVVAEVAVDDVRATAGGHPVAVVGAEHDVAVVGAREDPGVRTVVDGDRGGGGREHERGDAADQRRPPAPPRTGGSDSGDVEQSGDWLGVGDGDPLRSS